MEGSPQLLKGTVKSVEDVHGQLIDFVELSLLPPSSNPCDCNTQKTLDLCRNVLKGKDYEEYSPHPIVITPEEIPPNTIPVPRLSNSQIQARRSPSYSPSSPGRGMSWSPDQWYEPTPLSSPRPPHHMLITSEEIPPPYRSSSYSQSSPKYIPTSPDYSPSPIWYSPTPTPTPPDYSPSYSWYSPSSPTYSPPN